MLTEATRARRGARRHRDPRRGDGLARAGVRGALRHRRARAREVAALLETAERTAQPFHAPRRRALRLGDRAVRRPARRGRGAARALARVEPAADRARRVGRLRHPDVQHPPRAGAPGRARPVVRILAGESERGGPWRPGLVVAARRARHGRARRGASWPGSPAKGSTRSARRSGSPRSTYLADACAALGDERDRRRSCTPSSSRSRART